MSPLVSFVSVLAEYLQSRKPPIAITTIRITAIRALFVLLVS
jgi:hypothetical protein